MKNYCYNCMSEIKEAGFCTKCLKDNNIKTPAHHLLPGTLLNGRYLIGFALGEGGFGITYIGLDTILDIKVAVKEYYPNGYVNRNHENSSEIITSTEKQREFFLKGKDRFLMEARSIAKFSQEKGIVDVRDYFEENSTAYIIMEYLDGVTLAKHCKQNGVMNPKELFTLMLPVMKSLEKMHNAGVVHRDISPDNVMYMKNGTLRLMDFGSARYYTNDEKLMSVMLKQGYAPEEQYRKNGKQGPWTDIYGMCATMYRCITGKVPDDALDRLYEDNLKTPSQLGIKIEKSLEAVLMHGLAVHRSNRYTDMNEMMTQTKLALNTGNSTPKNRDFNAPVFYENKNTHVKNEKQDLYRTVIADEKDGVQSENQNRGNAVYSVSKSQIIQDNGYSNAKNQPPKQKKADNIQSPKPFASTPAKAPKAVVTPKPPASYTPVQKPAQPQQRKPVQPPRQAPTQPQRPINKPVSNNKKKSNGSVGVFVMVVALIVILIVVAVSCNTDTKPNKPDNSTANAEYTSLLSNNGIYHLERAMAAETSSAFVKDNNGIIEVIEFGSNDDTIVEMIQTSYYPIHDYTENQKDALDVTMHNEFDDADSLSCCNVVYSELTDYYRVAVTTWSMDNTDNLTDLNRTGVIDYWGDGTLSKSATEKSLLNDGYIQK
ncbi:MAG: protein kinase [Ruminococcus sp.]|nr:protein kinase [Ruminococcus sp.]